MITYTLIKNITGKTGADMAHIMNLMGIEITPSALNARVRRGAKLSADDLLNLRNFLRDPHHEKEHGPIRQELMTLLLDAKAQLDSLLDDELMADRRLEVDASNGVSQTVIEEDTDLSLDDADDDFFASFDDTPVTTQQKSTPPDFSDAVDLTDDDDLDAMIENVELPDLTDSDDDTLLDVDFDTGADGDIDIDTLFEQEANEQKPGTEEQNSDTDDMELDLSDGEIDFEDFMNG